jgi:plasmid maintenance system antidote protein VapI
MGNEMRKSAKRKLRNNHPGEVLREEFLIPPRCFG